MLTITPHVYRKLAYDPLRDFVPISTYVLAQTALCVHAGLPVKTVREFVELAKARPAALNMASAGIGSTSHLGGLLLATRAGIEANHVPYKGGGPSIAAVARNPMTMIRWGITVVAILVLGSLPLFVGLAVALPVLGYATWHLYTRVVAR